MRSRGQDDRRSIRTPAPLARSAWAGSLLLVLATMLPVLFLNIPPMVDVLGHIGRYQLQTGLDVDPWLRTYYGYEWQVIGNLGADLLVEATHPLLGTVGAARFAVALVPALAASAILLLSRQVHGRITPFAVSALTLVYALPFTWGFLNFALSMALALLAFALWLRMGRTIARALLFVPLGLGLWLCHTFGWAFLGILCAAESLASRHDEPIARKLIRCIADGLPLTAPLVPMMLWRGTAPGGGIEGWFDLVQKGQWLASILRLDWQAADLASAFMLLATIGAAIASRRIVIDRRIGLAAAFSFAAFVVLPKQIFGSVFADMRLVPYAVLLALLACRFRDGAGHRIAMVAAVAFLGMRLALTGHVYHQREQAIERHLTALDAIPAHARVAMLVEIPCRGEWALPWYSHLGSLALTRKPVFVNDQWANAGMNPLQVRFAQAGAYATDDRQLFFPARCGTQPTLDRVIGAMPLRAFTHVWLVGGSVDALSPRRDLTRVWHGGGAAVFAVSRRPVHPGSLAH